MICKNKTIHLILRDILEHQPTSANSIGIRLHLTSKCVSAHAKHLQLKGMVTIDEPRRLNGVRVPRLYWAQNPCGCALQSHSVLSYKSTVA